MSNNSNKSAAYHKGTNDRKNKKYNPPSGGVHRVVTTIVGAALGGVPGALLGLAVGDSSKECRQKKQARGAYHAGHKKGR